MDKRNQMENPFFDPDKLGSIFVGMDRYHQYSPHQPRNALTFIQKGDADSLFRKFLIDNIKEAECCPYIPDTELLRFDLANMRQVPPVDTHTPFEEYISKELLPYFQEHCIPPAKRISLRDAVYTYKYKNEPDGGILKKYLMQEPAYLEFRLQQQEKRTLYRCQPRYTFPLKVVENDFGYLIFSGNEIGRNGFRECIRYITDHYFDPHYDTGHLAVYDSTFMDKNLVPLIDAAYKPCKPMELDYSFDFYPASYIGLDELPKEFIDSLKPVCYHSMEATAGDFIKFATDWHFNKDTQVSISRENHDIYRLLTVMRNGYMNIHEQPFTYFNELLRKYSINSLVYWVTYVHNVVYSFYRSMIYCYINSTQRCAGSIVIDIIPTNGADKRKFFPFAPYFPVTNVIKRYFYPYFPAIIGIKGYSFPYFPYLSGIMKIKTALYSLFSRLDWHKTVVFPCLGEIYEGIRSLSWEIPVT